MWLRLSYTKSYKFATLFSNYRKPVKKPSIFCKECLTICFLICYTNRAVERDWNKSGINARVAELADALDSGSSERLAHGGSSPPPRTTLGRRLWISHSGAKLWDTPVNNRGVPLFYVHFWLFWISLRDNAAPFL